jgi:hypothetical protein
MHFLYSPDGFSEDGLVIPKQYTIDEAAAVAGRTPKAMRQLRVRDLRRAANGLPPEGPRFRKVAGRIIVDENELARWLGVDREESLAS